MPSLTTLTAPVREFFTLSSARRTATAYSPAQRDRVRGYVDGAERRLLAGRRTSAVIASDVLLREAVVLYLRAARAAEDPLAPEPDADEDLATRLPVLAPDPARPRALPTDDERVRAALASRDPLYFDGLSPEDAALARTALDRAASSMRRRVEARSLTNLRATRWGRAIGAGVLAMYLAVHGVRALLLPPNVALNKPVIPSSVWYPPPPGQTIVDGDVGTSFGIHTHIEDSPSVVIDLQGVYRIYQVQVHNRLDGFFDDCLPLVVEASLDDKEFTTIGRRDEPFDRWSLDGHNARARYVRLRVARKSYLALAEVEVFGQAK